MKLWNNFKNLFNTETYTKGLSKTRHEFGDKLTSLSLKHQIIDETYFEELEEILIRADVGVETTTNLINKLKKRCREEQIINSSDLKEVIVDELFITYVGNEILTDKIKINESGPTVLLFVGVNGVGKTTTIAKLAYQFKCQKKKVMMIAADTFRAGAVDQLKVWGTKLQVTVASNGSTDPTSVIYDGLKEAVANHYDMVLIDTAGRLQNKVNLMNELAKMNKAIGSLVPGAPAETLLVIDATTGQNGISQAKSFKEITNITGIVLTKLDGTAKGGIVLAIRDQIKIPVKYVGLGETMNDLEAFDIEKYIYGLVGDNNEEKEN